MQTGYSLKKQERTQRAESSEPYTEQKRGFPYPAFIKSDGLTPSDSQKAQNQFRNQVNVSQMSKGGVVIVDQQEEATSDLRSSVGGIIPKQG